MKVSNLLIVFALVARLGAQEIPGFPKRPHFDSYLSLISQISQEAEPEPSWKGSVSEVVRQEYHIDSRHLDAPPTLRQAIHDQFSKDRLVSKTTSMLFDGKQTGGPMWTRWKYDDAGRVANIERGHDAVADSQTTDFQYDAQNRITSHTTRQSSVSGEQSRTELQYEGATVEVKVFWNGDQIRREMHTVDGSGRIIDYKQSSNPHVLTKGLTDLPFTIHVRFEYDAQGRVILQEADDHPFSYDEALTGRLMTRYDDVLSSREQTLSGSKEIKKFRFAATGDDKELTLTLTGDAGTAVSIRQIDTDSNGNWIERRLFAPDKEDSPRVLAQIWRQSIRYSPSR